MRLTQTLNPSDPGLGPLEQSPSLILPKKKKKTPNYLTLGSNLRPQRGTSNPFSIITISHFMRGLVIAVILDNRIQASQESAQCAAIFSRFWAFRTAHSLRASCQLPGCWGLPFSPLCPTSPWTQSLHWFGNERGLAVHAFLGLP